jgi:hypothetical protein
MEDYLDTRGTFGPSYSHPGFLRPTYTRQIYYKCYTFSTVNLVFSLVKFSGTWEKVYSLWQHFIIHPNIV